MRVVSRPAVRHVVRALDLERGVLTVQPRDRRFRNCGPPREVAIQEVDGLDTGWREDPGDVCWTPVGPPAWFPKMPDRLFYAPAEARAAPVDPGVLAAMDAQP